MRVRIVRGGRDEWNLGVSFTAWPAYGLGTYRRLRVLWWHSALFVEWGSWLAGRDRDRS